MGNLLQRRSARTRRHMVPPQARGVSDYRNLPAFALLQHASETVAKRMAVRYGQNEWDFQQLNQDAIQCAAMLQRLGVRPGDRVALLLPNIPEYLIAAHGIWRAGGVVLALSPLMVASEIDALIESTDCKFVIALDVLAHLIPRRCKGAHEEATTTLLVSIRRQLPTLQQLGYWWVLQRRQSWSLTKFRGACWFWSEMERTSSQWQPISIQPSHDPAYIIPTGGTTSDPKAVVLSHQGLVANAWQQFEWTGRSFATEKMIAVLPFFHSYGMSAVGMGGIAMGASIVVHHRFSVSKVVQLIEREAPTVLHVVPAMLVALNERLRRQPLRHCSLRWVISGGAPLEVGIATEFMDHTGALVVEGYGLSEASPVTHVGDLFGPPQHGTIGYPLPETQCRLVDDFDRDVAKGEVGELVVRGPQLMIGYWNDPEETAKAIRSGWLYSGDLARQTETGAFQISGRKKDLIITSGFNVYPGEVEAVLREIDGVSDAAVVGYPDPCRGEVVKAFIVMDKGVPWDQSAMKEHCQRSLAKHKRPTIYERCDSELPRNFLGKVIRRHLREQIAQPNHEEPSS